MYKFHNLGRLNICYDMSTGGADGGGAGDGMVVDTGLDDLTLDDFNEDEPEDVVENKDTGDDVVEEKEDIDFDNLFDEDGNDNDPEFNVENYEELKEMGVNTDSPNFKAQIGELKEIGITDPKVQLNLLKKARENEMREYNKTPQEIKEELQRELIPEAKRNFKAITNVVKDIFGDDAETLKTVMSDSTAVNMIAKLHEYYKGSAPADVTPANTKPKVQGFNADQAEKAYQKLMTEAYAKGKGYEMRDKVIEKVLSRTLPQEKATVMKILGYNK